MRADAQHNRQRLLDAAYESFAEDGLSVPVREIARRAEVSTGTLSRHFPTKDDLYTAIVTDRVERLVARADALEATESPADALFGFVHHMVEEGGRDRGLAEALAGIGFDVEAAAGRGRRTVAGALARLLRRAQSVGTVRADVDADDLKALVVGCTARADASDPGGVDRVVSVVVDGLRWGT